eukprot:1596461-Rhodomonas_salina.1
MDVNECVDSAPLEFEPTQTYGPVSSLAGNTAGWSELFRGSEDNNFRRINIPFSFCNFQDVYVGSNSYITFGAWSTSYSGLGASNPPAPTLFVGGEDNSFQLVLERSVVEGGVSGHVLRFEGTASLGGTVGSPNIVWEATFFENGKLRIRVLQHVRPEAIFALSDGQGVWLQQDTGIADGWLWYIYPGCLNNCDPDATCTNTMG